MVKSMPRLFSHMPLQRQVNSQANLAQKEKCSGHSIIGTTYLGIQVQIGADGKPSMLFAAPCKGVNYTPCNLAPLAHACPISKEEPSACKKAAQVHPWPSAGLQSHPDGLNPTNEWRLGSRKVTNTLT